MFAVEQVRGFHVFFSVIPDAGTLQLPPGFIVILYFYPMDADRQEENETTDVQAARQIEPGPRRWLGYLTVLALAGLVYGVSVAPGVLWQDSGLAQVRVVRQDYVGSLGLALAHPLFYLMAQAFQAFPFSESAFKTNLVSTVCSAVAVANLYLLLTLVLNRSRTFSVPVLVGVLALALAHTFWQHAAITETYNVSVLVLTFELLSAWKFLQTRRPGWWLLIFFLNGLECSNHMLATLTLSALVVWSLVLMIRRELHPAWLPAAVGLWVVGCLPFEYLGFQAWRQGQPLGAVIHSMLFGNFQKEVLNTRVSTGMVAKSIMTIVLNFPTPILGLALVGMIKARKILDGRLAGLLGLATAVHLAFAVRYSIRDQYSFFIMTVFFLSIWIAVGAWWWLDRYPRWTIAVFLLALVSPLVYAAIPRVAPRIYPEFGFRYPIPYRDEMRYFLQPWKTGYRGPDRLVDEVFGQLPSHAIFIVDSTPSWPFRYYQITANRRTDVHIAYDLFESQLPAEKVRRLAGVLEHRPVWVLRPFPGYCPSWILDNFELVKRGVIYQVKGLKPHGTQPAS